MKKETKKKPVYGVGQNVAYMLGRAWREARRAIPTGIGIALTGVATNLTGLFIAPVVLQKVETSAPLPELLTTIGIFALALILLNALAVYLEVNTECINAEVRGNLVKDINEKACITSYPNTRNTDFRGQQSEALGYCGGTLSETQHIYVVLANIIKNVLGFAIYLFLLSELNLILAVVVVATTAVGFFINRYINGWGYRHREESRRLGKELSYFGRKAENIKLAKDIRIFGLDTWLKEIKEATVRAAEAFADRRERVYAWTCVVDTILLITRNGIAYLYLINLVLSDGLSASQFLLYFSAFTGFATWVTGILSDFSTLNKQSLAISVVREFLDYPEVFRFEGGVPIPKAESYELKLENVTFRYPGTEKNILENINLTVRPSEKLAVVGLNGAGKTTLVKLLCGFYDPTEGRVLFNGVDIREFNRREYYSMISGVFQDMSVLSVTVAETVAQSAEGIDIDRVKDCIEKAGLTHKIESLPKKYDTYVDRKVYEDGVEFSGGETQRLLLARALYKDGAVLVLDEPTAALDPIAENDIYMKYNEMSGGKTSIFISHRLASTRFCDRILFIKDGGIAEEGTHESLLAANGDYAELFHVQARYYQEGSDF